MPDIEDVLEDAQREIKSIGDNVKSLKDNMEKNLADVRKIAEDAPKAFAASEQFKKDMEALTAGVLEKHDAIALKVKALTEGALKASTERMDDIEKKLNRGRLGGGWGDGDEGRKVAEARLSCPTNLATSAARRWTRLQCACLRQAWREAIKKHSGDLELW